MESFERQALKEAYYDSVLHLLHDAWCCYLHELAHMVSFRQPVMDLYQLMQETPLVTGEMQELTSLATDKQSWLYGFLIAHNHIISTAKTSSGNHTGLATNAQMTSLITTSNRSEPVTQLREWWSYLSGLIDRQRENRQES